MEETWKSYFDFIFHYTYFAFLPPFVTPARSGFKYLSVIFSLTFVTRIILLTAVESDKRNFEMYFMISVGIQLSSRCVLFVVQENGFREMFNAVNKILEDTNEYETKFHDLWQKHKPKKFVKYYTWFQVFSLTMWLLQAYYKAFFVSEISLDSPFPFYSPLFKWGGGYKIFNIVFDTVMNFSILMQAVYNEVVTITLLRFVDCLFLQLKLILEKLLADARTDNHGEYKKWIEKHVRVLNLINDLKKLLQPHIAVQSLGLIGGVVFNLLTLLEEKGNQMLGQKYVSLVADAGLLFLLGFQCSLAENVLQKHTSMYEILLKEELMYGNTKESYFLRMLMLRCQRPIKFTGYHFFTMGLINFKDLTAQIYSFYSSLISLRKKLDR